MPTDRLLSRPLHRWLLIGLTACTLAAPLWAAEPGAQTDTSAPSATRPVVGLVLSGGGARGFAHVGVLKALEAAQVPVDLIVGTSMGAIVGGLYASGMSADELEREILAVQWGDLFERREPRQLLSQRRKEEDFELSPVLQLGFRDGEFRLPSGAMSTRSLEVLLRRYTLSTRHLATFDGLPTPFRAVATDMETGQAVVMEYGDLAAALRASMSVPGVFAPLEVDGQLLGDGGLVNNLPVDVARRMGADVVIAVNIGTPLAGRDTLGSVLGITAQMVNILTEQNVQASIATLTHHDLLLQPPLGRLTSADFNRAPELVKLGKDYADSVREALLRFAAEHPHYQQWTAERRARLEANTQRIGRIASVRFEGVSEDRAERLAVTMDTAAGLRVDVPLIERDLQKLAATSDYERVDYRLSRREDSGEEDLTIRLRPNDWGPNYLRVGLDLRTDFQGQGAFNLRISHNRHWLNERGAEWRNRVQLGETVGLYSEIFQPLDLASERFVAAYVDANVRKVALFNPEGNALALVQRQGIQMGADIGWPMGLQGRLGDMRVGLVAAQRRATPELVAGLLPKNAVQSLDWREVGLRASIISDQLDHANFPSAGYRAKGEVVVGQRSFEGNSSTRFHRMEGSATGVKTWGAHTLNMGGRFAHASQIPPGALDEYSLGGFQQLSGYRVGQVAGNYMLFGRLSYYRRLPLRVGVARGLFAGGSIEAGNAWTKKSDISFEGLRAGASLFVAADTGIGPLYLSVVSAPRGYTGLYLFLGRP
ncbi:MAG: patatin-like phospholipase family protein [Hydrogenophaga sp.]|uniref:patatin-like phospholipase family protein n=1 Tax=Hydrogenophaga sp. TaxID=1904254 RepID=UPI002ABA6B4B|nr:patatin-like phospholipase family protein [Hydrogenophaga sp.]MDZ4187037.1 patatin-like phospholipase family protein [Hydrogenophaga sp.]